jgi:hypothetical protein
MLALRRGTPDLRVPLIPLGTKTSGVESSWQQRPLGTYDWLHTTPLCASAGFGGKRLVLKFRQQQQRID